MMIFDIDGIGFLPGFKFIWYFKLNFQILLSHTLHLIIWFFFFFFPQKEKWEQKIINVVSNYLQYKKQTKSTST